MKIEFVKSYRSLHVALKNGRRYIFGRVPHACAYCGRRFLDFEDGAFRCEGCGWTDR